MLKIKLLRQGAKAPTVAHFGDDIGYDLYAAEDAVLPPLTTVAVPSGIAIEFVPKAGAILGTRSGMAKQGFSTEGGWIDAGYRGEILVLLYNRNAQQALTIRAGDKIAQMTRVAVVTDELEIVEELSDTKRGARGFGSSGK